jgi:hypothetical protein
MKFTSFRTIKLATAPAAGDNPPSGAVYEWHSLDNSNNLIINYRLHDGTDKTSASGTSYTLPIASSTVLGGVKIGSGLSIDSNGLLTAGAGSIGTVEVLTASQTWTVPAGVTLLKDVWIIAGGGGGGGNGGGGGAGGVRHLINYGVIPAAGISVVIGAGGAGDTAGNYGTGSKGGNSSFDARIAYGGGGGAGLNSTTVQADGGNGGGGSNSSSSIGWFGKGLGGQGWDGGKFIGNDVYGGGGGGGAGFAGLISITGIQNGDGGDGIDLSYYVGTSIGDNGWFAGGGGGGTYNAADNTRYGRGGRGGGGNGGYTDGVNGIGHDAIASTGSGGGGSSDASHRSGNGASGTVIIRY